MPPGVVIEVEVEVVEEEVTLGGSRTIVTSSTT
jgi:hypothetical protein